MQWINGCWQNPATAAAMIGEIDIIDRGNYAPNENVNDGNGFGG